MDCCHCGNAITNEGLEVREIGDLNPHNSLHFCNFECLHAWAAVMNVPLTPDEMARVRCN